MKKRKRLKVQFEGVAQRFSSIEMKFGSTLIEKNWSYATKIIND